MNAKKVKALRKQLRAQGVAIQERDYKVIKHVSADPNKPHTTFQFLLVENCGRAKYKAAKFCA